MQILNIHDVYTQAFISKVKYKVHLKVNIIWRNDKNPIGKMKYSKTLAFQRCGFDSIRILRSVSHLWQVLMLIPATLNSNEIAWTFCRVELISISQMDLLANPAKSPSNPPSSCGQMMNSGGRAAELGLTRSDRPGLHIQTWDLENIRKNTKIQFTCIPDFPARTPLSTRVCVQSLHLWVGNLHSLLEVGKV